MESLVEVDLTGVNDDCDCNICQDPGRGVCASEFVGLIGGDD